MSWKPVACAVTALTYGLCVCLWPFSVFTFLLGIPVCGMCVSFLHECGHLLAYRLLGLSWKCITIAWFVWERGKGLRVERDRRMLGASCTCVYEPHIPFWRYLLALLGGGLFCLLLGIVAVTAACLTDGGVKSFCLCFGVLCGINAAVNLLLPFSADRVLIKQIKQERETAS